MNLPIGSIIGLHKSFPNTPALPPGFVEMNGQVLDNPDSPYDGQTIPNWNGEGRFLRGGATSGVEQDDAMQGHGHRAKIRGDAGTGPTAAGHPVTDNPTGATNDGLITLPTSDGANGTPRIADETRPKNASVVWIMKVADSDDVTVTETITDGLIGAEDWKMVFEPDGINPPPDLTQYFYPYWANNGTLNPLRYRLLTDGRVEIRGEAMRTAESFACPIVMILRGAYEPAAATQPAPTTKVKRYNPVTEQWVDAQVYFQLNNNDQDWVLDVSADSSELGPGARLRFEGFTFYPQA